MASFRLRDRSQIPWVRQRRPVAPLGRSARQRIVTDYLRFRHGQFILDGDVFSALSRRGLCRARLEQTLEELVDAGAIVSRGSSIVIIETLERAKALKA